MTLSLRQVTVARGGTAVLDDVSFDLEPGNALILRGPNGIGKTTLLRTIAGLQPLVEGDISCPPESIAYAAHSDGLKATLTVLENLTFWARIFGTKRVDDALAAFDLTELADRPAGSLSAGQKRRLGLSRLLVAERPYWVLDEPTVSLDTSSVRQFASIVGRHLSTGGAALIATHIDLGLEADVLDLGQFRARARALAGSFDESFL